MVLFVTVRLMSEVVEVVESQDDYLSTHSPLMKEVFSQPYNHYQN